MKKRFLFVLVLGMSFAPTALAGTTTGPQTLSQTNMSGVRCGSEFMDKKIAGKFVAPSQKKAKASRATAAL